MMNPKYPVYIISKGRHESRMTAKALDRMRVPYYIVIDPAKILVLPFSNLGQGSIPARNWVWDHSMEGGHERHWILDDNIRGFFRFNRNFKVPCETGAIFRAAESFVDRYINVPMSGFNYFMFAPRKALFPPYYQNTRIYSCILLENAAKHRWRGRYNEDTDLSLRFLKDGDCTILFNAFLADKITTMTMKGGNTDELYAAADSRIKMTQSLIDQHPDIVRHTFKFNHHHHQVDYSGFKNNRLIKKEGITIPQEPNEFGMKFVNIDPAKVHETGYKGE